MFYGIDFSSDTVTRPSEAMKRAMIEADLGDEQKGEDPTTNRLEFEMAKRLKKSAALFFPSATMCNQLAINLHCSAGDEILGAESCHIFINEGGGAAFHSRVQTRMIATRDGIFDGEDIKTRFRYMPGYLSPKSRLVIVENTHNSGGGVVWPKSKLSSVHSAARELGLKTHLDGARLFNAAIASGSSIKELAEGFDTITVCFSKGLGCATGAILAFDEQHYDKVRTLKQIFGGSMRQSGILAAACLYALEHHVEDLAHDHEKARRFTQGVSAIEGMVVEHKNPDSNMVFFAIDDELMDVEHFLERCFEKNLRFSRVGKNRFRAVTHRDITLSQVDEAIGILKQVFSR
jgi:threonine aldolase